MPIRKVVLILGALALLALSACAEGNPQQTGQSGSQQTAATALQTATLARTPTLPDPSGAWADVLSVAVDGAPGAYTFSVEVASPDEGCERYADWWEVLGEAGSLLYRRVLLHSHTGEQPFTRSGGPVPVTAEQVVIVRAHFSPDGYGGAALKGSVEQGFQPVDLPADFARGLEQTQPLPEDCDF